MISETKSGKVIKSTGKEYSVLSGSTIYTCVLRGKMRLAGKKTTNPVAVGDNVKFKVDKDHDTAIIEKVCERKNHLLRKSTNLSKKSHVIAANIDYAILMASLTKPVTTRVFIDRFLVSAKSFNIPAVLIFNKTDLYNKKQLDELKDLENIYSEIVEKFATISVKEDKDFSFISDQLNGKVSVISGHSGVGKSSFINKIDPALNLKTGIVSDYHKSGKHTTSYAEMHKLKTGSYIIDTPGIRAFGINHIEKEELYHFFPEIFKISSECKFYNCLHTDEPGCEVKKAVINGRISESRYNSYLQLFFDENTKHRESKYK